MAFSSMNAATSFDDLLAQIQHNQKMLKQKPRQAEAIRGAEKAKAEAREKAKAEAEEKQGRS